MKEHNVIANEAKRNEAISVSIINYKITYSHCEAISEDLRLLRGT